MHVKYALIEQVASNGLVVSHEVRPTGAFSVTASLLDEIERTDFRHGNVDLGVFRFYGEQDLQIRTRRRFSKAVGTDGDNIYVAERHSGLRLPDDAGLYCLILPSGWAPFESDLAVEADYIEQCVYGWDSARNQAVMWSVFSDRQRPIRILARAALAPFQARAVDSKFEIFANGIEDCLGRAFPDQERVADQIVSASPTERRMPALVLKAGVESGLPSVALETDLMEWFRIVRRR